MGLFGRGSSIDIAGLQKEYEPILAQGETLESAYTVIRDMFVFTNKRLILVDKQGLTGSKTEYTSIPYKTIIRFSKESAGMLDLDAELKIWVTGQAEPIKKLFKKDNNVNEVYQLLSNAVLG
jgi:hypothetical protein